MHLHARARTAALPLVLALFAPCAAAQEFGVFDLDPAEVLSLGAAFRISESGIAAGLGVPNAGPDTRAVRWIDGTTAILPPLPDHEVSEGYDVNASGVVAGVSFDVVPMGRLLRIFPYAVTWTGAQPTRLSSLVTGGDPLELQEANRVDTRGRILGTGRNVALLRLRAFVLDGGIVTDLGALSPTGGSEPYDMNEQGAVVGSSESSPGVGHAFIWRSGVMTDLHDPVAIPGRGSTARAINEAGVIVGSADFIPDLIQIETAAIWEGGTVRDLGTLDGPQSYAHDINEHGTIVGTSTWSGAGVHAFIARGMGLEDLNELIPRGSGWVLANAYAITNDGRIVGEGFHNGLRPFLLVPECNGRFSVYGVGCTGSGGFAPALSGQGCPEAGSTVSLALANGLGGAPAALLLGAGSGAVELVPGCALQVLPLFPLQIPLRLGGQGPGAGSARLALRLPGTTPAVSLFFQGVNVDPGAPAGLALTNGLRMDIE